jgi:hypothetical protein
VRETPEERRQETSLLGRVATRLAARTSRRSVLARMTAVTAWLVGSRWIGNPLKPWAPFDDWISTAYGQPATIYVGPLPPAGAGGPPGNTYGAGDGCHRKDQGGMTGCDCRCMYGVNDCPPNAEAPPGAAWCACIDVSETATPSIQMVCYTDCFAPETTPPCTNTRGRNCGCIGHQAPPHAGYIWPRQGHTLPYHCTRMILIQPPQMNPAPGGWFATYDVPTSYFPGTPLTYHEVLEPMEEHPGTPLLDWN